MNTEQLFCDGTNAACCYKNSTKVAGDQRSLTFTTYH